MKKILVLVIGCLLFASCSNGWDMPKSEGSGNVVSYPKLKVINDGREDTMFGYDYISSVVLLNYSFTPIEIKKGESQTFVLDKGMPGGYNDILVKISYGEDGHTFSSYKIKKNFANGSTTTIRLYLSGSDIKLE